MLQADDGGYFIVGGTNLREEPDPQGDIYLIRTDAEGETLWEKTYGGPEYDTGTAMIQASAPATAGPSNAAPHPSDRQAPRPARGFSLRPPRQPHAAHVP